MQFSTNSNEAIRSTIRACPTYAGQYRQAVVILRDRRQALQAFRRNFSRVELELERANIELSEMPPGGRVAEINQAIKSLEIEEKQQSLSDAQELVEDCEREIAVCIAEINRIITESAVNFPSLPPEDYQEYMEQDFRMKRARYLAAGQLSRQIGLPPDRCEALLETPADQLSKYLDLVRLESGRVLEAIAADHAQQKHLLEKLEEQRRLHGSH